MGYQCGWRPAFYLKPLGQYLCNTYFTLPMLKTIILFVHQGWWGVSVDLSSAYRLAMYREEQSWMGMCYDGATYWWLAMPFGLSNAPREWQRLIHPVVLALRAQGFLCCAYLGDFLALRPTPELAAAGAAQLVELLQELALKINCGRSQLTPVQRILYLGFLIDLHDGMMQIPEGKIGGVTKDPVR